MLATMLSIGTSIVHADDTQPAPAPEPASEPSAEGAVAPDPSAAAAGRLPEEPTEPLAPIQPAVRSLRTEAPPPAYVSPDSDEAHARYPDYVIAGVVSLIAGVGLGVGSGVAAATQHPKTALGLGMLATTSVAIGLPLVLLGTADDHADDEHLMAAGIVVATPGAIAVGSAATLWAFRAAGQEDHSPVAPAVLMAAGGAALVAGIVTWAFGAPHRETRQQHAWSQRR